MATDLLYRRRQFSWPVAIACLGGWLIAAVAISHAPHDALPLAMAFVSTLTVLVFAVFGSLLVELDARELRWQFGWLGVPHWRLPLSRIHAVEATRQRWWEGWGIRFSREGTLYSASGLDAVRIVFVDGRTVRLGSSDAQALVAAMRPRLGAMRR